MGFGGNVSLTERLKRRADKCAEDGYERDSALFLLAAAEIESMRAQMFDNLETARAAIERLTAERDDARRMYCKAVADHYEYACNAELDGAGPYTQKDVAKDEGWDCFKEDGK